jgi:hypothetical protein
MGGTGTPDTPSQVKRCVNAGRHSETACHFLLFKGTQSKFQARPRRAGAEPTRSPKLGGSLL